VFFRFSGVIIDDSYTLRKIFDQSSKQNVRSIRTTLNRFLCVGAASIVSNSVARVYGHVGNAQVSSGYEAFSDSGDAPGNTTTKQTERPPTKFVYVSDSTTSTESTPHKELSEPSQTLISPVKQLKGESCFETAALVHKKNSKRKRLTVNGDVGELLDHCDDDKRLKKQKPALNTPTATYRAQSAYKLEIKQGEAKLATRLPVHRYEDTKPSGGGGGLIKDDIQPANVPEKCLGDYKTRRQSQVPPVRRLSVSLGGSKLVSETTSHNTREHLLECSKVPELQALGFDSIFK